MSPTKKTKSLNIRLSEESDKILSDLIVMYGMDKTSFIENLLRYTLKTRPKFVISPAEPPTDQPNQ